MTNEQLMDQGNQMMDDTDQAIERGKRVGLYLELIICYSILFFLNSLAPHIMLAVLSLL
jgi:hypothetical protein